MDDLERKADAFLEATELHVAEADKNGLSRIAVARLLCGFAILLLEKRDGSERTAQFLRHQLARLESASPLVGH